MKMNKSWITVIVGLLAFGFIANFVAANWHCCKPQGCEECKHDILGCNCELREKLGVLGFKVCNECRADGCGQNGKLICSTSGS